MRRYQFQVQQGFIFAEKALARRCSTVFVMSSETDQLQSWGTRNVFCESSSGSVSVVFISGPVFIGGATQTVCNSAGFVCNERDLLLLAL